MKKVLIIVFMCLHFFTNLFSQSHQDKKPFITFEEVTDRSQQYFRVPLVNESNAKPAFIDYDNDGDYDLLVGDVRGKLSFYKWENEMINRVSDSLNPFVDIDVGMSAAPTFVDLDDDQDLDLVVGCGEGKIKYFENKKGFYIEYITDLNPFKTIDVGENSTPTFIDLDQDGDQDLVIGNREGILVYFKNDNAVFLEQRNEYNPFLNIKTDGYSVPAFTKNKEGKLGLVVGTVKEDIEYYELEGTKFFKKGRPDNPFVNFTFKDEDIPNVAPTFVDYDSDGDQDLVLGTSGRRDESLCIYEYEKGRYRKLGYDINNPLTGLGSYSLASTPTFVDIDQDGDQDLISGGLDGYIYQIRNSNDTFKMDTEDIWKFINVEPKPYSSVAFSDLDQDSINELYVNHSGAVDIYHLVEGEYKYFSTIETPDIQSNCPPVFMDVDNDSDLDLILGMKYGGIAFYLNEKKGFVRKLGSDNPFDGIDVGIKSTPTFADLDQDGDQDLVIGEYYGTLHCFINESGKFKELQGENNPFEGVYIGGSASPTFVDINKDGDQDLIVGNLRGIFIEFRNTTGEK